MISVDTKKKELVGNFKNGGREWQPKGTPPAVLVHDFPTDAEGKAIPYGVYDMARNEAWVSVGWDHDTPAFALRTRGQRWQTCMYDLDLMSPNLRRAHHALDRAVDRLPPR